MALGALIQVFAGRKHSHNIAARRAAAIFAVHVASCRNFDFRLIIWFGFFSSDFGGKKSEFENEKNRELEN